MTDEPGGRKPGQGVETLRAATREAHGRLDRLVDLRTWDATRHRWWLQRMLGLHEPLEHDLAGLPAGQAPDLAARRRSPAIAADLRQLGLTEAEVRSLPRSPLPPRARERGRALGQLYVLDGSALGGAVIATHAIANGVPAQACTSLAHSRQRITVWHETRRLIDDLGPGELDEAVRAAVELFAVFEAWLHTPAPAGAVR
ncbi:biliverdin-producing heme oxygenase [Kineosporia sp. J2-2]|uniref:Biliverdin-producing heme oxygenase n=1 Tax=Kineosporia corallincola TaxID=2835133 RepID=A0ABS5TLC7_9ACTN|nr:biliverdin-producing heme oxygenase [Kineosporia corallincola]MBT0771901.1 biliverdin-producing heme oxygenase [Kineosporia corallincola]